MNTLNVRFGSKGYGFVEMPNDSEAKRLRRKNPRTGKRRSLRQVASELEKLGHLSTSGKPYGAESVKRMISRAG